MMGGGVNLKAQGRAVKINCSPQEKERYTASDPPYLEKSS